MSEETIFYEGSADNSEYFNFHVARANFMPAHFHNNVEIMFVKKGNVKVAVNGINKIEKDGDIVVSNSFDVHYYMGDPDSIVYILVFSASYLNGKEFKNIVMDNFLPPCKETTLIFSALDFFLNDVKISDHFLRVSFVNFIVGILLRNYKNQEKKVEDNSGFREILSYIGANIKEDLTADGIAKHFGYTKNYFSMLFNRYTGMHFRRYLNRVRIERVNSLIDSNKDISISSAVFDCGFKSLNTYYRALHDIEKNV